MSSAPIFCTVFDKNYLYQGVTLYHSLEKVLPVFSLYCLALDAESVDALQKLAYKNLKVISIEDLPQKQVEEVRSKAHYGQFCWAMQPLACRYVLEQGEQHATYIEADAYFFSDPSVLLKEIETYDATVAPHWYAPENQYLEPIAGRYCTHFNFFRNNPLGKEVLEDWRKLNFQYTKEKPLFYPGQKGLDEWPIKFNQVCELKNRGAGVAPWNVQQYQITQDSENCPRINGVKTIFYHFHQLVRTNDGKFELGTYPLSEKVIKTFYKPYVCALLKSEAEVRAKIPSFTYRREISPPPSFFAAILSGDFAAIKKSTQPFRRKLKGTYNIYEPSFFGSSHG